MKKLLLTLLFATASWAAFAQLPTFGIKAGANFAKLHFSDDGSNVTANSGTTNTVNAGAFVDFKFGDLSLRPSLNFYGEGGKVTEHLSTPGGSTVTETSEAKLYYLQLPVDLVYHVPVVVGNIYFGAGPYIAQGISGHTKVTGQDSQKITFGNDAGDVKSTQAGVGVMGGFAFKGGLFINLNYDLGLTNDVPKVDESNSKSRVFGVSLGFTFL